MSMERQYERELEGLENELEEGCISQKEYNQRLRDLDRDYREAARESAREAYNNEYDRW